MRYVLFKSLPVRGILRDEKGSAVLLTMAALIALGAAVQMSTSISPQNYKTNMGLRVMNVKTALISQTGRYASLPATFRTVLHDSNVTTTNKYLYDCVYGISCSSTQTYPITLYFPNGSNASGTYQAASSKSGVYYDVTGNVCATQPSAATTLCPFKVTSTFTATCPGGTPTCPTASSFTVTYQVDESLNLTTGKDGSTGIPLLGSTANLSAAPVDISSILPPVQGSWAANAAGSSDSAQSFVTVGSATGFVPSSEVLADMSGVTSTNPATILAIEQTLTAVINGPSWYTDAALTQIADLGITNTQIAEALAGQNDPSQIPAMAAAVAGISNPGLAAAIIDSAEVTSASEAQQLVSAVAGIPENIAESIIESGALMEGATLIGGGSTAFATQVAQSIASAVSGVSDPTIAESLAASGVTNATEANQIASVVASAFPSSEEVNASYAAQAMAWAIDDGSIPSSPALLSTIATALAAAPQVNQYQYNAAIESGIFSEPGPVNQVALNAVLSQYTGEPLTYYNQMVSAGVTNQNIANAIADIGSVQGPIPNSGVSNAVVNTLISAGITNGSVAEGLAQAGITSVVTAQAVQTAVNQATNSNYWGNPTESAVVATQISSITNPASALAAAEAAVASYTAGQTATPAPTSTSVATGGGTSTPAPNPTGTSTSTGNQSGGGSGSCTFLTCGGSN